MIVAQCVKKYQNWIKLKNQKNWNENEQIEEDVLSKFESAASFLPEIIANLEKSLTLRFYGLYKQVYEGPPDVSKRPAWYEMTQRTKFDAWEKVSNLSRSEAMKAYCDLLSKTDPSWDPNNKNGGRGGGWNLKPSKMGIIEPEMFDDFVQMEPVRMETEIETRWFNAMREDDLEEVKKLLEEDPNLLEATDQHLAMTALARSIDLGCEKVAQFLISKGANVNVVDTGGQTPLHFAAQCHRQNLAELLIAAGADRRARDADGNTPSQCCNDEHLAKLLSPTSSL